MKCTTLLAMTILSAGLAIGCDDKNASTPAAQPTAGATNEKAKDAAADLQTQMADNQTKTAAAIDDAKSAAKDTGDSVVAQAQDLYAKATTALSNMKPDDAQKYVDQLKTLRDKLPAEWQTKVDDLAKMVNDAKAKMTNLPNLPTMPK